MVLVVDIGNTNIVVGVVDKGEVLVSERITSDVEKACGEYAIVIKSILQMYRISEFDLEGSIISSVVPMLNKVLKCAIEKIIPGNPLMVRNLSNLGIDLKIENPGEIGDDLLVAASYGVENYQLPLVVVDMGTSTTISVIDSNKNFIGGAIIPGMRVSLDALVSKTAQLCYTQIEKPKQVIGRNTEDCIKSGLIYGSASMIDCFLDKIEDELGEKVYVVATGGLCEYVVPHCNREIDFDRHLMLKGLYRLYLMNN